MAEPTALRLHDNQSFQNQLGHAVHSFKLKTMAHLQDIVNETYTLFGQDEEHFSMMEMRKREV
eukprot:scaffold70299_cov37-Attheya_sp.AAC.1